MSATATNTIVTLFDGAADFAKQEERYRAVAGRASMVRSALKRTEREIAEIHEAVDAEEDGAEALFAHLPAVRAERDRLALLLAPLEDVETAAVRALESYGIRL